MDFEGMFECTLDLDHISSGYHINTGTKVLHGVVLHRIGEFLDSGMSDYDLECEIAKGDKLWCDVGYYSEIIGGE